MDDLSFVSGVSAMAELETIQTTPDGFGDEDHDNGNNLIGRCILTAFVPNLDAKWLKPETYIESRRVQIWCGQFEECPTTERLHVHIYAEFLNKSRYRFNDLRVAIDSATGKPGNIQIAKRYGKKQRQAAVNYVSKDNGRFPDTEAFFWEHNKIKVCNDPTCTGPSKKSSKQDVVQEQLNYIESKPKFWSWDKIVHETPTSKLLLATCSWGPRFHNGRFASAPRREITNVIILYGAGGTGKTTMAQNWDIKEDEHPQERYYKRNGDDGKFWGGGQTAYNGQRVIHLEEFCGSETAANFKEICDIGKPGPSVNIKNSGTELNHDTVIITSNTHPAGWYRNLCTQDFKQWTPICRRFTTVLFFPKIKLDGSLNSPDSENEPYYEDHTADFQSSDIVFSYERAKDHADQHWPLAEVHEQPTWNSHS